jgi:hypothetical protein
MPNIKLAQQMLETLKVDFKAAFQSGSRDCGNITIENYQARFGVSTEDIDAYCATLTPLVPLYPVCVLCGNEWSSTEKIIKPIHNGQIINFVDHFTMWCVGSEDKEHEHDTMWYFQDKEYGASFNLDTESLNDNYIIRWNCHCGVKECYGKTVIVDDTNDQYKIIKSYDTMEELPFNIALEKLKLYITFQ